jgi:IS30 family transposase
MREEKKVSRTVHDRACARQQHVPKPKFRNVEKSIPLIPKEIAQDSPCGYWEHPDQFVGPGL